MESLFARKEISDFLAVVRCGNFSKAADALGVQQSGLSKSIQRLEKEIGCKLFVRGSRKLRLTEAGEICHKSAEKALSLWADTSGEIRSLGKNLAGTFQLGCHPLLGRRILPPIFKQLSKEPGLQLQSHFCSSREAVEGVRDLRYDICVAIDPLSFPELVVKKLWSSFPGLYSKSSKKEDLLFYSGQMVGVQKILASQGLRERIQVDDYGVLAATLLEVPGSMGILPNPVAENHPKLKLLQKVSTSYQACLVYRYDREKTAGFSYLLKTVKDAVSL